MNLLYMLRTTIERYKYDFIFMFYSHVVYICKTERNKEFDFGKELPACPMTLDLRILLYLSPSAVMDLATVKQNQYCLNP